MENTLFVVVSAGLCLWMVAGFAAMETGFSRAKNASNTILRCIAGLLIAIPVFLLVGSRVAGMQQDAPVELLLAALGCAVVLCVFSGAVMERMTFAAFCAIGVLMAAGIYPLTIHMYRLVLVQWGYHDFSGLASLATLGGLAALSGAKAVGPRIGKYSGGGVSRAMPGHNIPLSLLGMLGLVACAFTLAGSTALNTHMALALLFPLAEKLLLSACVAGLVAMLVSWARYRKPDITITGGAVLAGVIASAAGCDEVSMTGTLLMAALAGFITVFGVENLDQFHHVDDPAGVASVFTIGGVTGLLGVGLFSLQRGLLYGGGFTSLGVQTLGVVAAAIWVQGSVGLLSLLLKKTVGLRLPPEQELEGLDLSEHGLVSSYHDFSLNIDTTDWDDPYLREKNTTEMDVHARKPYVYPVGEDGVSCGTLTKIEIIARKEKFEPLKTALNDIGITGMTVFPVSGCGVQKGHNELYRGIPMAVELKPKVRMEVVVAKVPVADVVNTARHVLYTGHVGDGKIFIHPLTDVVRVRTGESGYDAMQGASSE
ncbi:MAG TPA: P-II family nitrogen regulator [Candidatus Limiplasma sp.]|nr:P-II family nitrogen regulator [Candidatus Limiplasma sp.]HPS81146.1 P-II family nitrogen regulator [Candidatus Limiplasma sp.]